MRDEQEVRAKAAELLEQATRPPKRTSTSAVTMLWQQHAVLRWVLGETVDLIGTEPEDAAAHDLGEPL